MKNTVAIASVAVILLLLLLFLIRNRKDRKELEKTLKEDYRKPGEAENDVEDDAEMK